MVAFTGHGMVPNALDVPSMAFLPELLARWDTGEARLGEGPLPPPPPAKHQRRHWKHAVWDLATDAGRRDLEGPWAQAARGDVLNWQPASWYAPLWPQLRAFALPSYSDGTIRWNLRGREAAGRVDPAEVPALTAELTELLSGVVCGRTGAPVVDDLVVLGGPRPGQAPRRPPRALDGGRLHRRRPPPAAGDDRSAAVLSDGRAPEPGCVHRGRAGDLGGRAMARARGVGSGGDAAGPAFVPAPLRNPASLWPLLRLGEHKEDSMTRIHLSLRTTDLEASTRFYTTLFGAPPDKLHEDYARFQPEDAPITLSLMPGTPGESHDHLGLKFPHPAGAKAAWQRLTEAGVPVTTQDEVTCCWATANKVWAADPDGRAWEVYTVTDDAPGRADGDAPSTCCA